MVERRTDDRAVLGSNPTGASSKLRQFLLCLSEETLTSVGPFYLVSMPGEVKKSHTGGKCVTCRGLPPLLDKQLYPMYNTKKYEC